MGTAQRSALAMMSTISLMVGGLIYNRVFKQALWPMIDTSSRWATPTIWLEQLAPLLFVMLLLGVWAWVVAGAVQEERTVDRRRRRL